MIKITLNSMVTFKQYLQEKFRLTLQYHDELNPKLWEEDSLKEKLRDRLLEEGYAFADYCGISKDEVKDVVLTGGNANYNYTRFSDIDVHVIYDEAPLSQDELHDKKKEWAAIRPDKIAGYSVELYAQPQDEGFRPGQGTYSLVTGSWISKPVHLDDTSILQDPAMISKVKAAMTKIKRLIKEGSAEEIHQYREQLRLMRAAGLAEPAGEFSVENILYKELRNRGFLEILKFAENQRPVD